jgi:GNAT superfamily N-acetyltransferase
MLRIAHATTREEFQAIMRLRAEMGQWDAAQSQRLGLNPEEVLKFFYPGNEQTLRRENTLPAGGLLIASHAENTAGCAAFRRLDLHSCELHHVYVRNQFRGRNIGRQLVEQLIGMARGAGYQILRLETTTFMTEARALYASLGFKLSDPYYDVPKPFEPFAVFMERPLTHPSSNISHSSAH